MPFTQAQIDQLVALLNQFSVVNNPPAPAPDPSKVFSQADLDAAVAKAVADLKAKIASDLAAANADVSG